ncbi:hypothetical protein Scep_014454 [Stephania cephalantha]|uniref:Uncharacterized protein n=1 Tax=Stephania cephalantha TaxID=152367 RepID=A0AAP0J1C7_9MAGN
MEHVVIDQAVVAVVELGGSKGTRQLGNRLDHKECGSIQGERMMKFSVRRVEEMREQREQQQRVLRDSYTLRIAT